MNNQVRRITDLDEKTQGVIKLLKVHGTQTLLGTGADKLMDYISDIDLQEFVKCKDDGKVFKEILKIFQDKYKEVDKNKNIFITDFKCGVLYGNVPLRWDKESIKKGFQIIEDRKINFIDCLKQTSIIKMDIIALINGKFTEFSENYYFIFGKYKTFNVIDKHYLDVALLRSFQKYFKEGKPFKALKRLYSYQKKNDKVDKKIIKFLNSKTGKLNKLAGDLEIVIDVFDLEPDERTIKKNLRFIRKDLPKPYKNKLNEIIKIKDKEQLKEKLGELVKEIQEPIKKATYEFIQNL